MPFGAGHEAFGIAYLEALGSGLPVIASTAGAAHELITHGEHGFLVTPDGAATIAQYLLTLHYDRALLQHMSRAAYRQAQKHPTWSESAGRVRGLLQDLAR